MSDKRYDVVVIGGGPSGMAAAIAAAREGANAAILETDTRLGGILNQCIHNGFGLHVFGEELTGPEYAARFEQQVRAENIDVYLDTLVTEVTAEKSVYAVSAEYGPIEIEAGAVVFSTGCRERPRGAIGIAGTRPAGVLTAGAAQKYVNIYGKMPGKECVILGSGDIGLIMARRMTFEGAKVKAVVELMPYSSGLARNIKQCLEDYDIPLKLSHTVIEIHGKERVTGVTIAAVDEKLAPVEGTEEYIPCDTLLLSVGLIPTIELALMMGAKTEGRTVKVNDRFETTVPGIFICGNTLHVHDLVDYVTEESTLAGKFAAQYALGRLAASTGNVEVRPGEGISYILPNTVEKAAAATLRFRPVKVYQNVRISVKDGDKELYGKKVRVMAPGEMQTLKIKAGVLESAGERVCVCVEEVK